MEIKEAEFALQIKAFAPSGKRGINVAQQFGIKSSMRTPSRQDILNSAARDTSGE